MYGYSQPPPAPRIGDWFSEGFRLFGQEWVTWSAQGLLYFLAIGLSVAPGGVMLLTSLIATGNTTDPNALGAAGLAFLMGMGVMILGLLVGSLFSVYLMGGMHRTAWKQMRGEPITFRDMFSAGDIYLPLLGAYLLVQLAYAVLANTCPIGSIFLAPLWVFVVPLIVMRKASVADAFSLSWNTAKQHFGAYLGFTLLVGLLNLVGVMFICGGIFTLPITTLLAMIPYRDAFETPAPVAQYPSAPAYGPSASYYGPAGPPTAAGVCPSCGQVLAVGAVKCPRCGGALTATPSPAGPIS